MSGPELSVAVEPEAPGEVLPPRDRRKPLLLYALVGVVVVVFGVGGFFLSLRLFGGSGPKAEVALPVKAAVPIGSVVVNLGETKTYARVSLELGVIGAKDVKEVAEAKGAVLDLLITVLSTTPPDAMASGEGRQALKEELLERIRDDLGLKKVSRVYFTEFVLQ
jgi:flagellar basal body-associated protein FliL